MLTLCIAGPVEVGDPRVPVHIVIAVRNLGVHINTSSVQRIGRNVVRCHQGDFLVQRTDRVIKRFRGEGLVIRVETGINDRDTGTGTGITVRPGTCSTSHRDGGVRGVGLSSIKLRLILILNEHFRNARDRSDHRNVTIPYVSGDNVYSKGQIPLHVDRCAHRRVDGVRDLILLLFQAVPISVSGTASTDAGSGIALFQRGGLIQHDRNTNQIVRIILQIRSFRFFSFLIDLAESRYMERRRIQFIGIRSATNRTISIFSCL